MANKDSTQKTLEGYNDIFADIVNVLLYDGARVVHPDSLTAATTHSQYKAGGAVRSQDRDVAKYWMNGNVEILLLGIENQTEIDSDMPFRVIGYDGAAYRDQVGSRRTKSGRRTGKRHPVITLVLYFGWKREWKKPISIRERVAIPPDLEPYVSDYKINVFNIAFLPREVIDKFTSDFYMIADFCYQKRCGGEYVPPANELVHPGEALAALSAFTGDLRYEEVYNERVKESEGGEIHMAMCEIYDGILAKGKEQGIEQGIEQGAEKKENSIFSLRAMMKDDGRLDEFDKALDNGDREMLDRLTKEYGLE